MLFYFLQRSVMNTGPKQLAFIEIQGHNGMPPADVSAFSHLSLHAYRRCTRTALVPRCPSESIGHAARDADGMNLSAHCNQPLARTVCRLMQVVDIAFAGANGGLSASRS